MVWGQARFFSEPPHARNSRFALASLLPLFPLKTQKITPVLQASMEVTNVTLVLIYKVNMCSKNILLKLNLISCHGNKRKLKCH